MKGRLLASAAVRCIGLIISVLAALPGTPALAQAPPSHYVFVGPYEPLGEGGAGLVGGKFVDGLKQNLAGRQAKLVLLSDAQAPEGRLAGPFGGGSAGTLNLQAARVHVKVGEGLLDTDKAEAAMTELSAALEGFEANLAFVKDESELLNVHLKYAAAAFMAGYDDDGEAALKQALIMNPELSIDSARFPPLFKRLVGKFKRRMKKLKKARLSITSDPSPATVYVDGGDPIGETPIQDKDAIELMPGAHYIRVVRPMMGVWARKIDVGAPGEAKVLHVPLPTMGAEATGGGDKGAADAAAVQSVKELSAALAAGDIDRRVKDRAYEVALRVGATHVVFGVVAPAQSSYALRTFLLRVEPREAVDLGVVHVDPELLELGVMVHEVAERIVAALDNFPMAAAIPDEGIGPALVVAVPVAMAMAPSPPPPPTAPLPVSPLNPPVPAVEPAYPPQVAPAPQPPVATNPPVEPITPAPSGPQAVPEPPPEPRANPYAVRPNYATQPAPPPIQTAQQPGWSGRWWLWTALGVVAIGGGTAAALLLLDNGDEQPRSFRTEVVW